MERSWIVGLVLCSVWLADAAPQRTPVDSGSYVIEWAVQMKRLPADATLESRLEQGDVSDEQIRALAERVASFHRDAKGVKEVAPAEQDVAKRRIQHRPRERG